MKNIEDLQQQYDKRSNYYRKHLKLSDITYGKHGQNIEKIYSMEIQKSKKRYYRIVYTITENAKNFEIKANIEFRHMYFTNWTLFGPRGCEVDETPYVAYQFTVNKDSLDAATKETKKLTQKYIKQTR